MFLFLQFLLQSWHDVRFSILWLLRWSRSFFLFNPFLLYSIDSCLYLSVSRLSSLYLPVLLSHCPVGIVFWHLSWVSRSSIFLLCQILCTVFLPLRSFLVPGILHSCFSRILCLFLVLLNPFFGTVFALLFVSEPLVLPICLILSSAFLPFHGSQFCFYLETQLWHPPILYCCDLLLSLFLLIGIGYLCTVSVLNYKSFSPYHPCRLVWRCSV